MYAAADRTARADGDDGSRFRRALDDTLSDLLAVLVRSNFKMIGDPVYKYR